MAEILQFPTKEKSDPHGAGEAFCLGCNHTWVAVAPVGDVQLECPKCGTMKGLWKFPFEPETTWQCNCGNKLFYLTLDGHLCPNCGILNNYGNGM